MSATGTIKRLRSRLTAAAVMAALPGALLAPTAARAVVVDMNALGQTSISADAARSSGLYGVTPVPGTDLAKAKIPVVTPTASCSDPLLTSDLIVPPGGLCWQGGPIVGWARTFAITWDPVRQYWAGTRAYMEQFLRDVADATNSKSLTSPFAVISQYGDAAQPPDRAASSLNYHGGCIDFGQVGGSACNLLDATGAGAGNDFPASGCGSGASTCLTDAQLQSELTAMVSQMGLLSDAQAPSSGATSVTRMLVLLLPPGVQACLDAAGTLCSAGSGAPAEFCSYHSHLVVGGSDFAYVVQPWTANTSCDEPDLPGPPHFSASVDAGMRLVSPLSAGVIAAAVNPDLNGWFGPAGAETGDNGGCAPGGFPADLATLGTSSQNPYYIQAAFSNAGLLQGDPGAQCALAVALAPTFVVPNVVNAGDVVTFDGSVTQSTLLVPRSSYQWDFGDGKTATGPSVAHTYADGGTYPVKLTVTDRGGNVATAIEMINVGGPPPAGGPSGPPPVVEPEAHIQLLPQSLHNVLAQGVGLTLSTSEAADGVATVSITRAAARRAHIKTGRSADVVLARGFVSGITTAGQTLHLKLPGSAARKLAGLRHLTITVRMALVTVSGHHVAIDVAGQY